MKQTSTLQIRAFPYDINKALKMRALKEGITFRQLVVNVLSDAAKPKAGAK